jgi:enoyl-CoA hydratase/carnithine racemase
VATVTLDRPEKRNALSIELRREFARTLSGLGREVRATVVTGRGSAFCAGMDTSQFGGDKRALVESTEVWLEALRTHPRPLIAAVNGPAVGGGFVLALLCDIRVAGESARFGFPELARGIPAGYGAARAALPRAAAAELALTGRIVGAEEARRLGIVSAVAEDALTAARDRAAWIARLPERGVATTLGWVRSDRGDPTALLAAEHAAFRAALLGE